MTSVRVVTPLGESTFPRCTVDEFVTGVLTVSSVDTQEPIREFEQFEWLHATAYTEAGYPVIYIPNRDAAEAIHRRDAMTRRLARVLDQIDEEKTCGKRALA